MATTVVSSSDARTVRRYAGALFNSTMAKTFMARSMMEDVHVVGKDGQMANAPVVVINDVTSSAGDKVSFDLYVQLTGAPTFGDDILENNLEDLSAYTDEIIINQIAHGVNVGGRMSQKRTVTDLRNTAKVKLEEWFAQYFDQAGLTSMAGARGVSDQLLIPLGASAPIDGGSPYSSYDAGHIRYGGAATSKASLVAGDKMSLDVIDRVLTRVSSIGGGADGAIRLAPLDKNGEDCYKLVMSPLQEHDLRKNTNAGDWLDIQKAAAGATGNNSHLFKNTLGIYRGVHMHKHQHVVQFNDYGAGQNIRADRAVFLGRQAMAVAFGSASSKGLKADWTEETTDMGRRKQIGGSMMYSFKLPKFNNEVIGSYAIDTAVSSNIT